MDTLERLVAAEIVTARLKGEDFYHTMVCQNEGHKDIDYRNNIPPCGQKFKFIKHAGGRIYCPRCGAMQRVTRENGILEAISAIPVD